jgi:hypothetical protein
MNETRLSKYFKNIGIFHIMLMITLQSWIFLSSYIFIVFTFQKRLPEAICFNIKDQEGPPSLCNEITFCDTVNYRRQILYDSSLNNWTLKYSLFCENEKYLDYLSSLSFFCVVSSGLILSPITDYLGRLIPFRIEIFLILSGFILMYFENSLCVLFMAVTLSFLGNNISSLAAVYLKEFLDQKFYGINMVMQNVIYCIFGFLISYYINTFNDLDNIFFIIIWFTIGLYIISNIFFIESPVWLEENYKERKKNFITMKENFNYVTNINLPPEERNLMIESFNQRVEKEISKKNFEESFFEDPNLSQTTQNKEGIFHNITLLFMENENRKNFLICTYLWFMNQIIFYMVVLNLDKIHSKIPYSIYIFYIADIFSNVSTAVISHQFGRKFSMTTGSILTSICSLLIYYIYDKDAGIIGTTFFFLFAYFACLCGNTVYLYVQELFDAKVVATGSTYSKMPAKFILMIVPLIVRCNSTMFLFFGMITMVVPFLLRFTRETRQFENSVLIINN